KAGIFMTGFDAEIGARRVLGKLGERRRRPSRGGSTTTGRSCARKRGSCAARGASRERRAGFGRTGGVRVDAHFSSTTYPLALRGFVTSAYQREGRPGHFRVSLLANRGELTGVLPRGRSKDARRSLADVEPRRSRADPGRRRISRRRVRRDADRRTMRT